MRMPMDQTCPPIACSWGPPECTHGLQDHGHDSGAVEARLLGGTASHLHHFPERLLLGPPQRHLGRLALYGPPSLSTQGPPFGIPANRSTDTQGPLRGLVAHLARVLAPPTPPERDGGPHVRPQYIGIRA